MDDLDAVHLAEGFDLAAVVTVENDLVEAQDVAHVLYLVHRDLEVRPAAARRRRVHIPFALARVQAIPGCRLQ